MNVSYIEGFVHLKEIFGRLSQHQYKTICRRLDEVIPLFPVLHRLRIATRQTEQPDIPYLILNLIQFLSHFQVIN